MTGSYKLSCGGFLCTLQEKRSPVREGKGWFNSEALLNYGVICPI
ncbi:hypothetical protein [Leptolyngbya sp. 'hensonii']|nr:hypothetical protein [Leptolyngbya sp. 'hensonii']